MNSGTPVGEKESPKRLFIPSLTLLIFTINLSSAVISLFLPEIAKTFLGSAEQAKIGIVSQTSAVSNAAQAILAIAMSVLAIRFRHKSLLLAGAVLVVISYVGGFLSPDLITFQIFFAIEGAGSVMVSILAITLIGDTLPFSKKARAVSWFVAGGYMVAIIGLPTLLFLANIAGWRSTLILFGLPLSVAGLILAFVGVPSKSNERKPRVDKGIYVGNFKQILLNKSSSACLIGNVFSSASVVSLFIMTFYRQQLTLSSSLAVGLAITNGTFFLVGSLIGGRMINKFGAKTVAVTCGLTSGILTAAFFNMPNLWLTLVFNFTSVIIGAFAVPAYICLTVDQVPKSRGTMMSLHRIAGHAGQTIGTIMAGALIALFSYQILGLGFGALMVSAAAIFFFLVKQPTGT
jgi:predicted MFS family arabinose efflux permease